MKRITIVAAAVAMLSALAPSYLPAYAAEPVAPQGDIKKELQKLMNAYGSGEISSKEYKARKEALLQKEKQAKPTR